MSNLFPALHLMVNMIWKIVILSGFRNGWLGSCFFETVFSLLYICTRISFRSSRFHKFRSLSSYLSRFKDSLQASPWHIINRFLCFHSISQCVFPPLQGVFLYPQMSYMHWKRCVTQQFPISHLLPSNIPLINHFFWEFPIYNVIFPQLFFPSWHFHDVLQHYNYLEYHRFPPFSMMSLWWRWKMRCKIVFEVLCLCWVHFRWLFSKAHH